MYSVLTFVFRFFNSKYWEYYMWDRPTSAWVYIYNLRKVAHYTSEQSQPMMTYYDVWKYVYPETVCLFLDCVTMRSNRVPPGVRNAHLQVGQLSAFRSGPLLWLKYKDKKDVYMLTSQHDESIVPVKRGRGRPPRGNEVTTKPICIVEYNSNMGSVDKQDQMLKPYSIAKKSMK